MKTEYKGFKFSDHPRKNELIIRHLGSTYSEKVEEGTKVDRFFEARDLIREFYKERDRYDREGYDDFLDEVFEDEMSFKEMRKTIKAWQEWWNKYGCEWYNKLNHPYAEKPPHLKEGSSVYGKWID